MKWVDYHEYVDRYPSHIILRQAWYSNSVLIATKWMIITKPLFTLYDKARVAYYMAARRAITYSEKRGWLKRDPSEKICWASIREWRKNAKV